MTEKPSRCDSVITLLRIILRSEGPKALFRGLAPTLWAVVPFTLVQSATLDIIRDTTHAPSAFDAVVASALAGIVAQTAVFPLDTVHRSAFSRAITSLMPLRRRMQIGYDQRRKRTVYGDTSMPHSTLSALRHIVRNEGFAGLFRGMTPAYLKSVPSAIVGSCAAITIMDYYKSQNERRLDPFACQFPRQ